MMNIPLVDLKAQYNSIENEINEAIFSCLQDAVFIGGERVGNFEEEFSKFCEAPYCASCGNGTDALEIALQSLGVSQGDEVIVPATSFIATSEAVTRVGAKVVFCEINPSTYNIDVGRIENKLNSKTKAIIAVHLYGQMAEMEQIAEIAKRNDLFVIEDAAQAHGGRYNKKPVGFYSDMASFSFFPAKNLGAYGDAGAIVTKNKDLYIKAKKIANHGRLSKYNHEFEGRNSRMDSLHAGILSIKLKHLRKWTIQRQKNASVYNEYLQHITQIKIPAQHPLSHSVFHLYVIKTEPKERDNLKDFLKKKGVQTGIHYPIALPFLQAYDYMNHKPEDFPISFGHAKEILTLPMYPELSEDEIKYVCDSIREYFAKG